MTLVEMIISISLFIFMAAAICATLVLSFRTSKTAHLDLAAYNLAADLCGQMQMDGYATFAAKPATRTFQGFDPAKGDATVPIQSSDTYTDTPSRSVFILNKLNFVRIETDAIKGTARGDLDNSSYTKSTSTYEFAVTPSYELISETAPSGVTVRYVRISVEVALPNQTDSGLPGWLAGDSRKPVRVSAVLADGINASSSYINF